MQAPAAILAPIAGMATGTAEGMATTAMATIPMAMTGHPTGRGDRHRRQTAGFDRGCAGADRHRHYRSSPMRMWGGTPWCRAGKRTPQLRCCLNLQPGRSCANGITHRADVGLSMASSMPPEGLGHAFLLTLRNVGERLSRHRMNVTTNPTVRVGAVRATHRRSVGQETAEGLPLRRRQHRADQA
jgi:hypothetical protein